jgi:hypothetical protein
VQVGCGLDDFGDASPERRRYAGERKTTVEGFQQRGFLAIEIFVGSFEHDHRDAVGPARRRDLLDR